MRFVSRKAAAGAATAVLSLALAAGAGANVVEGGKTTLVPDPDTFEALADMSIAVETTGKAEWTDIGAKFPVRGGDIDPQNGFQGIIGHGGGLLFSRSTDGASVKFKNFTIEVEEKKMKLFAFADHEPIKLAKLAGPVAGTDTSVLLKNAEASLAKQGAEVLSETFDFPYRKGIPLGTTTTKATITEEQVEE